MMFAAAHFIAQVRRRGVDRRQAVDGAERGPEPAETVAGGKAAIEQLRGAYRAHGAGGGAEHDGDQPLAVTRGGRHQVVAGSTDEAGLETVGAGIASDQAVEILGDPAPETDRGEVHEIFVFRQVLDDAAGKDGEVTRGS